MNDGGRLRGPEAFEAATVGVLAASKEAVKVLGEDWEVAVRVVNAGVDVLWAAWSYAEWGMEVDEIAGSTTWVLRITERLPPMEVAHDEQSNSTTVPAFPLGGDGNRPALHAKCDREDFGSKPPCPWRVCPMVGKCPAGFAGYDHGPNRFGQGVPGNSLKVPPEGDPQRRVIM